jgi:hypothetical protein
VRIADQDALKLVQGSRRLASTSSVEFASTTTTAYVAAGGHAPIETESETRTTTLRTG